MPRRRGAVLRRSDARARRRGDHGHERQDDDGVPAARDPHGRRAARGPAHEHRAPRRRRAPRATGLNTPEAIDLQRLFRADARRGRHGVRDGGDVDRAGAGAARRDAVRRARVHEPDAGPPRLPRLDGGVLRRQARTVRAGRAGGRERRRRVRPPARGRAARTRSRSTSPAPPKCSTASACKLPGAFNRENASARALAARALGVGDDAIRRGIESRRRGVPGRFEAIDEGQPFAVIVDYAHTPGLARQRPSAPARELGDGRLVVVFGAGGDRDRDEAPLMGRVASELADRAIVTSDNPRSRGAGRDRGRGRGGCARRRSTSSSTAAPPSSGRSAAREPGDVVVIAGRGAEPSRSSRDGSVPFDDREVARKALRRRRGARVIPLELDLIEPLGRLHARPWAERGDGHADRLAAHRRGRSLRRGRAAGADFVRHALALGAAAALVPDDPHARARDDRWRRTGSLARARRRRSPARPARRRRRTSSRRSARATAGRSRPRGTTTTSSACRSRSAGSSPTPRSASPRWGCAASARSHGSRRSLGRTSALITNIGPVHLELVGTVENVARAKAELIDGLPSRAASRSFRTTPLLEPYLTRTDIEIRRFGHVRRARDVSISVERRSPRHELHGAPPAPEHARRARCLRRSRRRPRRRRGLEVEFSPLREEEVVASGRRPADQRLLQREPAFDARSARAPRRARRDAPTRRRARRDGRARSRSAAATTARWRTTSRQPASTS